MAICTLPADAQRRTFWTTQPGACGSYSSCGFTCGVPGLSYTDLFDRGCYCCPPATVQEGCVDPCLTAQEQVTLVNTDWLRSIIINMLMTDGRMPDTQCGYRPGSQGGHWSESYIQDGPAFVGTLMRTVPARGRIQENLEMVTAFAQSTLQRLVTRGVAVSVTVEGEYLGNLMARLNVTVLGSQGDPTRIGLTGARTGNEWTWG